jgi:CO dehydrogenase/acetyl-CoA synthase alpha subunit
MDKQTTLLELKGLSRVVSREVRNLVHKRHAVEELAESYEPENPFLGMLDLLDQEVVEAAQNSMYQHLSDEERHAFRKQWNAMPPYQQLDFLNSYVMGDD